MTQGIVVDFKAETANKNVFRLSQRDLASGNHEDSYYVFPQTSFFFGGKKLLSSKLILED